MAYAKRKVDGNQPKLVGQMRDIPGLSVVHTHTLGNGMTDVVVGFRGVNYLLEIKDPSQPPSKRKLTKDEQSFHQKWTGQISIVETIEDVFEVLKIN